MSIRTRVTRKRRKNILRVADKVDEELLNRDDDGNLWPKEEWGYSVRFTAFGHNVCCPDRNRFDAWQGANECLKWIMTLPKSK